MSSHSKSRTLPPTATPLSARQSAKRRPAGQYGSRSQNKPGKRLTNYLRLANRKRGEFLFAAQRQPDQGLSTRQYARLLADWIRGIGLDSCMFGTHSLRRTKATLIYRRTGNLRAVQLLLGHTKIESTVRYLGIEVDDALAIAEQIDV